MGKTEQVNHAGDPSCIALLADRRSNQEVRFMHETHIASHTHAKVYRRLGTRNCSWLRIVVGIFDAFVGSECRRSEHSGQCTQYT